MFGLEKEVQKMQHNTTDNEYFSLLDRLNRIPVILPVQAKKNLSVKQQKEWLYEDLLKENGEALV